MPAYRPPWVPVLRFIRILYIREMKTFFLWFLLAIAAFPSLAQNRTPVLLPPDSLHAAGNGYALVFGVSDYKKITDLLYADDDAFMFKEFLINNNLVKNNEKFLRFYTDSNATRSNFFSSLGYILARVHENDNVFIYFAGHGDIQMDIDLGYLLAYGCELNTDYNGSDAIPLMLMDPYVDKIASKGAKVYLILDACRSGKAETDIKGESKTYYGVQSRFKNTVKLLSSSPDEYSIERHFANGGHGLFTYYLVQGWSGLSVTDNDTTVDLKSLKRYVEDKVADASQKKQNPMITGDNKLVLSSVIPLVKQSYSLQSSQPVALNEGRNTGHRGLDTNNTYTNPQEKELYTRFIAYAQKGQLLSPSGQNATEVYENSATITGNPAFKDDLKWELISYLEDNSQKLINLYVAGELGDMRNKNMEVSKRFDDCRKVLEKAAELIGPDDPYYNVVCAKALFAKGYSKFKTYNMGNIREALTLLNRADSLLPNTAYIQNAIGLCYVSLNSDQCIKYFERASALAPNWVYPKGNLEYYYKKKKRNLDNLNAVPEK